MAERLYRSRDEKIIAGVCGGVAEYFKIDPLLVRVAWVVLTLISGFGVGVLLYIILWVVVPLAPPPAAKS